MTKIRHFVLLFAVLAMTTVVNAQNLLGDMNHNGSIDVGDITLLIDDYLSGESEEIPYTINNSLIAGRWYLDADEYLTFYEDGTSDAFEGARYTFYVIDDYGILVFNLSGIPMYIYQVPTFTDGYLSIENTATGESLGLTRALIVLSEQELTLVEGFQAQLTAFFIPEDAGTVYWSSNDPRVATVSSDGLVTAVSEGTAIITAEVAGVPAVCFVKVVANNFNNGYEYADLGLSVKWATMNIGANSPEEYGDYFAWGETKPKNTYSWGTYKWCKGSYNTMTKYCTASRYGTVDNKSVLDPEDDAAHVNWGGTWRMPTRAEQDELRSKCTWTWTTQNGVNGRLVTGPNGNSIFLPAAGGRKDSSPYSAGSDGYYWSSSLKANNCPDFVGFYPDAVGFGYDDRCLGLSVRAVCP